MPDWVVVLISTAASTAVTTIIGFVIKRYLDKYFTKKDNEEREREAKIGELERLRAEREREERREDVEAIVSANVKPLEESLQLLKKGNQEVLKYNLNQIYREWSSKGYCPHDEKLFFEAQYQVYHSLGKNGVLDTAREALLSLPEQPKRKKQKLNEED